MKAWLRWVGALAVLTAASSAFGSDHNDGPGAVADPAADINDVYAYVGANGNLVLAMTVFPAADAGAAFSDATQYVFNLDTGSAFQQTTESMKIVCSFDAAQAASCYLGTPGMEARDWAMGDASVTTGLVSANATFTVFAGLRADPFFFNLDGFRDAVSTVITAAPTLTFDEANCPNVNAATSALLVDQLQSTMAGSMPAVDFFAALNTMAIVVELDPAVFNPQNNLVSVWGSTHQAP